MKKKLDTESRHWAAFFIVLSLLVAAFITFAPRRQHSERITLNLGGSVIQFLKDFSAARVEHKHYIIDGMCISACTMITGEIPPEDVCVTPFAKLAFHAAFFSTPDGERIFSPEGTELIWRVFPEWVREYLKKQGWEGPDKDQPTLIWMEAPELLQHYKAC